MEIAGPMRPLVSDLILKRFEHPGEVQDLGLGRFELVRLTGVVVGRSICLPGWRWSVHVRPKFGRERCDTEQLGLMINRRGRDGVRGWSDACRRLLPRPASTSRLVGAR
jgi:hypothetical protein